MSDRVYHGTTKCNAIVGPTAGALGNKRCTNGAYYSTSLGNRCGTHSRNMARKDLPKLPENIAKKLVAEKRIAKQVAIETARASNALNNQKGTVIVTKMRPVKAIEEHNGFLKVFPNNKQQNREDGFGCCSLSPMRLGPVHHGQPGLPPAQNIENFHQGSKCFQQELDADDEQSSLYEENRLRFYNDAEPHRHKYVGTDKTNKNIPRYFVWVDKDGVIHKLDYVSSRQFYCTFYERLASSTADFAHLRQLIDNGTNIQIVGYDGRSVGHRPIEAEYLDPSEPFGHELVLYTMLAHKPDDYPWRKYKTFDF